MRKYAAGFRLALSRELVYRTNFFFGRIRELIIFGGLLYLFSALPNGAGPYDQSRLLTYALAGLFVATVVYVFGMERIANEIADGDLTNFLLRPVHYLWFWVAGLAAARALLFVAGIIEIALLLIIFPHAHLVVPRLWNFTGAVVLLVGSIVLVQILDFIAGIFSFWTHRGHGPRWGLTILILTTSGAFFPIDLYPEALARAIKMTPFPTLAFFPIKAYLGDLSSVKILEALVTQWSWIAVLGLILFVLWSKGVKSYEAQGR